MNLGCGPGVWTYGIDLGYGHGMDARYELGVWTWDMDLSCGCGVWTQSVDVGFELGMCT